MRGLIAALAAGVLILGCSGGKQRLKVNEVVTLKNVITMSATEVNDKPKRKIFDILIKVKNLHKESVVFFVGELECYKGKVQGSTSHAFFGAGERTVDLKLGEEKEFRFKCNLPKIVMLGDFRMRLKRVHTNPNNDGKTTGKVIAKDIELKITNPRKKA